MANESYNGWTNYETWNWKLWIDNDQGWYEYWQQTAKEVIDTAERQWEFETIDDARVRDLAERLQFDADEMAEQWMPDQSGPFADLLNAAIDRIEWREIAESMLAEVSE